MYPYTLKEWRHWGKDDQHRLVREVHDLWEPLAPFFAKHGLILFKPVPGGSQLQPNLPDPAEIRAADGYHHWVPALGAPQATTVEAHGLTGLYHMARTTDGKDVIIRLVAIGQEGRNHIEVLRDVATPPEVARKSHVTPLLHELEEDGRTFAVFPLLFDAGYKYSPDCIRTPWYKRVSEVLEVMEQLLTDFGENEVLLNYGAAFCIWWERREIYWDAQQAHPNEPAPLPEFRSAFPAFYYINDLEYAIKFPIDSDPADRKVVGTPTGHPTSTYGKALGPEALGSTPYCPFKMDIFQLGWTFSGLFGVGSNASRRKILGV
ncbi:hypothetical protein RQP46_009509 [Phenoliferia psychrophenolica]